MLPVIRKSSSSALTRQRQAGGFLPPSAAASGRDVGARRIGRVSSTAMLSALMDGADLRTRLADVGPAVRAMLTRGAELEAIHAALLALARDGRIELRAESGDEAPDRDVLPAGPRGSYLATARIL